MDRDHERIRRHNELRLQRRRERQGLPPTGEPQRTIMPTPEERQRLLGYSVDRDGLPLAEEIDLTPEDEEILDRVWDRLGKEWDAERAERMRKSAEWLRSFGIEVADDGWLNAKPEPRREQTPAPAIGTAEWLAEQQAIRQRVLGLTPEEYALVADQDMWLGLGDDRSLGEQSDFSEENRALADQMFAELAKTPEWEAARQRVLREWKERQECQRHLQQ